MVKVGQRIVDKDSGRELIVTGVVDPKFVESGDVGFDFIATHCDGELITSKGSIMASDRAFKYSNENFEIVG